MSDREGRRKINSAEPIPVTPRTLGARSGWKEERGMAEEEDRRG